jgi:hypothetical protein
MKRRPQAAEVGLRAWSASLIKSMSMTTIEDRHSNVMTRRVLYLTSECGGSEQRCHESAWRSQGSGADRITGSSLISFQFMLPF